MMQLEQKCRSVVKMERMYIKEIAFRRTENPIREADLRVHFSRSTAFNKDKTRCTIDLTCQICDPEEQLRCSVTLCGTFSCQCENEEMRLELLKRNTTSILFPYLRSQISLITAQPELTPIVLPAININALFDKEEE